MQTSTIKKIFFATVIGLASSAVIAAVAVTPASVNPVLAAISKSLKSPELNVSANIKEVSIAADTVELLKGSLRLKAVGSVNTIKGVIKFDYQNDGSTPKTVLSARVGLDLVKMLGRAEYSELITTLEDELKNFVTNYRGPEYAQAVTFTINKMDVKKDSEGFGVSIDADIKLSLDLSKLPATADVAEEPLQEISLSVHVNPTGLSGRAVVLSNTKYRGFADDAQGLKVMLEGLANKDQDAINEVTSMVGFFAGIVQEMANQEPTVTAAP